MFLTNEIPCRLVSLVGLVLVNSRLALSNFFFLLLCGYVSFDGEFYSINRCNCPYYCCMSVNLSSINPSKCAWIIILCVFILFLCLPKTITNSSLWNIYTRNKSKFCVNKTVIQGQFNGLRLFIIQSGFYCHKIFISMVILNVNA